MISASVVAIIASISIVGLTFANAYEGKIYPNVFVGVVNVSGLTPIQATKKIQTQIDELLDAGVDVKFADQTGHIDFRSSSTALDLARDYLYLDASGGAEVAMGIGRNDNLFYSVRELATLLFKPLVLQIMPELDDQAITNQLIEQFGEAEIPAIQADYLIDISGAESTITFIPGISGEELNTNAVITALWDDVNDLEISTLTLELKTIKVTMTETDALSLKNDIKTALENTPLELTYTAQNTREYSWEITADDLTDWLSPVYSVNLEYEEEPILIFQDDSYDVFMNDLAEVINTEPTNARFAMENGRVTEFAGSQNGVELIPDATMYDIIDALKNGKESISVAVAGTEPSVTTDAVNTLGITEILGVGISNFSGSPRNRIANIKHGAAKLNGLLIAPGDTLSLLENLRPFTVEDGYLPELVIKGDEIKPEVGGGLCQIGTTTFRAVMNSGLEVVERRNHSLVVSYYNDPSNNNPGTDATIYDPAPDFKFKNDTQNYILFTTDVDTENSDLIFTLWGTNDGRRGSYSAPAVLSWIGYGETQNTETLDLAPGEKKCQSPHPGATTSFDYTVEYADGTVFEKTYTSVYRSLPWICLVGVEKLSCKEGEVCEDAVESTETTTGESNSADDESIDETTPDETDTTSTP